MTTVKNFIDSLKTIFSESICTFNIYCDKNPTPLTQKRMNNSYSCRVLAVRMATQNNNDYVKWFYPNHLQELGLEYVRVNETPRRTIRNKHKPFEIRGNTEPKIYKDFTYYEHDIAVLSSQSIEQVDKIRKMFNIESVDPYIGEHHDIVLPTDTKREKDPFDL